MEWQPIEALPAHQGAVMLSYAGGIIGMGFVDQSWKGRWRIRNQVKSLDDGIVMVNGEEPTHWAYLPEPPCS